MSIFLSRIRYLGATLGALGLQQSSCSENRCIWRLHESNSYGSRRDGCIGSFRSGNRGANHRQKRRVGQDKGRHAGADYTLTDSALTVRITTYGAHVVSVSAPDRSGNRADVLLGFSSLAGYEADGGTYIGAIVGRYGNRIAKGTFSIDGK